MSNYDPFRLYDYKQKKSHKGQVIRKKFVGHSLPTVLTPEQLKEAKEILEGIGYTVTKNPIMPPPPTPQTQYRSFIYCDKLTNYVFTEGDHIMHLSDVWNDKIIDFQDLFVPTDRVNSFSFEINVIGYNFDGSLISTTSYASFPSTFKFYNAVDYKSFNFRVADNSINQSGGLSYFAPNSSKVVLNGGFNSTVNDTYDVSINGEKNRQYTSPFLYHYFDNSIETYTSIVTSDFTDYNPVLMQIGFELPTAITGNTVTVSSVYISYQITMTINANI